MVSFADAQCDQTNSPISLALLQLPNKAGAGGSVARHCLNSVSPSLLVAPQAPNSPTIMGDNFNHRNDVDSLPLVAPQEPRSPSLPTHGSPSSNKSDSERARSDQSSSTQLSTTVQPLVPAPCDHRTSQSPKSPQPKCMGALFALHNYHSSDSVSASPSSPILQASQVLHPALEVSDSPHPVLSTTIDENSSLPKSSTSTTESCPLYHSLSNVLADDLNLHENLLIQQSLSQISSVSSETHSSSAFLADVSASQSSEVASATLAPQESASNIHNGTTLPPTAGAISTQVITPGGVATSPSRTISPPPTAPSMPNAPSDLDPLDPTRLIQEARKAFWKSIMTGAERSEGLIDRCLQFLDAYYIQHQDDILSLANTRGPRANQPYPFDQAVRWALLAHDIETLRKTRTRNSDTRAPWPTAPPGIPPNLLNDLDELPMKAICLFLFRKDTWFKKAANAGAQIESAKNLHADTWAKVTDGLTSAIGIARIETFLREKRMIL
ncbi:hypothetical protein V5O48_007519 [Marasmius crinis-equi]|uniref:Uncharacterized protein n=1 Tax=Marasmius crinis-equi TaxID=585013 RepID=A0ABR3FGG0_9AGAR